MNKFEETDYIVDFQQYREMKNQKNDIINPVVDVSRYNYEDMGYNDSIEDSFQGGEQIMDSKEYVDLRINALEQNINQKFDSQQNLFVEKMSHLETKIDNQQTLILSKLDALNTTFLSQHELVKRDIEIISKAKVEQLEHTIEAKRKSGRNLAWAMMGVGVAAATLLATVLIPVIQHFLNN